jgi:hypothetical protein
MKEEMEKQKSATWKAEQRAMSAEKRVGRVVDHANRIQEQLDRTTKCAQQAEQALQSQGIEQSCNPTNATNDDDEMNGEAADQPYNPIDAVLSDDDDDMDNKSTPQGRKGADDSSSSDDDDEMDNKSLDQEPDRKPQHQPIPKPTKFQRPHGGGGPVLGNSSPHNTISTGEPNNLLLVSIPLSGKKV